MASHHPPCSCQSSPTDLRAVYYTQWHTPTSRPLHFLFPLPGMLQKSSLSTLSLLYSNVTSSVRPPSSTLLQSTDLTCVGPPCLLCLLNFSPETSNTPYHLLIYFVVYLLSPVRAGFYLTCSLRYPQHSNLAHSRYSINVCRPELQSGRPRSETWWVKRWSQRGHCLPGPGGPG